MMEEDILQLDDGSEYVLLDEITYGDKNYFYTIGFDSKKNEMDLHKYLFFLHGEDEEGEFVEQVPEDGKLYSKLLGLELVNTFSNNPEMKAAIEEQLDEIEKRMNNNN